MKIDFPVDETGDHAYCLRCHTDGVEQVQEGANRVFVCHACGAREERTIHIGDKG